MNASGQIFDRLAAALAEIRPRFGAEEFGDRRRVIGLLADKVPDAKREIRAIGIALDEGVPAALARIERHLAGVEMDRLANGLDATTGLRIDLARNVVRSFAFALDLGPPPSVYEAAMPMPQVPSGVSLPTAGWAGVSTPAHSAPAPPSAMSYQSAPAPAYHSAPAPAPAPYSSAPHSAPLPLMAPAQRPNIAGRVALGVAGFAVVALGVSQMMGGGGGAVRNGSSSNVVAANGSAGNMVAAGGGGGTTADAGLAGELADQGVAPTVELVTDVASPTPLTISVATRVTTAELQQLIQQEPDLVLIDVLASPHAQTLPRAIYLPSGGTPGSFQDSYQGDFAAGLSQATGDVRDRPLVLFCANANCWESHNAVLRANAAGYQRLYWYRGGIAAWAAARLPMDNLQGSGAPADPLSQTFPAAPGDYGEPGQ